MTTADPLIAFIHARLDEEQEHALHASPAPWRVLPSSTYVSVMQEPEVGVGPSIAILPRSQDLEGVEQPEADAQLIARHDPASVLRDVEIKRRIVGLATVGVPFGDASVELLRLLAFEWSGHREYQKAWHVPIEPPRRWT